MRYFPNDCNNYGHKNKRRTKKKENVKIRKKECELEIRNFEINFNDFKYELCWG